MALLPRLWRWLTRPLFVCHQPPVLDCLWCGAAIPTTRQVQVRDCAQQCRVGPYGWWHARGQDIGESTTAI
jgi:hypothetical protein